MRFIARSTNQAADRVLRRLGWSETHETPTQEAVAAAIRELDPQTFAVSRTTSAVEASQRPAQPAGPRPGWATLPTPRVAVLERLQTIGSEAARSRRLYRAVPFFETPASPASSELEPSTARASKRPRRSSAGEVDDGNDSTDDDENDDDDEDVDDVDDDDFSSDHSVQKRRAAPGRGDDHASATVDRDSDAGSSARRRREGPPLVHQLTGPRGKMLAMDWGAAQFNPHWHTRGRLWVASIGQRGSAARLDEKSLAQVATLRASLRVALTIDDGYPAAVGTPTSAVDPPSSSNSTIHSTRAMSVTSLASRSTAAMTSVRTGPQSPWAKPRVVIPRSDVAQHALSPSMMSYASAPHFADSQRGLSARHSITGMSPAVAQVGPGSAVSQRHSLWAPANHLGMGMTAAHHMMPSSDGSMMMLASPAAWSFPGGVVPAPAFYRSSIAPGYVFVGTNSL